MGNEAFFQHVYEGSQGTEFMASRPAIAVCGYTTQGKGPHLRHDFKTTQAKPTRCPDCAEVMQKRFAGRQSFTIENHEATS